MEEEKEEVSEEVTRRGSCHKKICVLHAGMRLHKPLRSRSRPPLARFLHLQAPFDS